MPPAAPLPAPDKKNAKRSNSFSRRKKKNAAEGPATTPGANEADEPGLSGGAESIMPEVTFKSEAQSDPLKDALQKEAEELWEVGDFDEAGEKFYYLAESYNHSGDTAQEIGALLNMGSCLRKMQQLDKVQTNHHHVIHHLV